MPAVGDLQVYTGSGWTRLSAPVAVDPETVGWSAGMPKPMRWVPADHGGEEPEDDPVLSELCEVLLCPNCDMELSAAACTPQHAYLADHPVEHRLLRPLLEPYLKQMRFDSGRLCATCSGVLEQDVVIATGSCNHLDIRGDQVLMSKAQWDALLDEVVGDRGAVAGLMDRLRDCEEALGNGLIWHYTHRDADIAYLGVEKFWRGVATSLLAAMTKRLEKT